MPAQPVPNLPHEPQPPFTGGATDSIAPTPQPPPNLDADIADELNDHLALATRDLQFAGHAANEANKLAHQKFGDIAVIRRRLWWIQKGDEVMLRTAFAAAFVILGVVVAAIGVGGWRMNQTINELGATLTSMNETQRALLESREKEDRPLAIRGRLYLGDTSKPASYASVTVVPLPDGKPTQQLMADEDGRFGTSSLPAGHYSILANLLPGKADLERASELRPNYYFTQSRPISVYPWSKDTSVELDVAMIPYGQVSFELTGPLPREIQIEIADVFIGTANIYPVLAISIPALSHKLPILRLEDSKQIKWPVIGLYGRREINHEIFVMKPPSDIVFPYSEQSRQVEVAKPTVFMRNPGQLRSDVFPAAKYTLDAYVTFSFQLGMRVEGGPVEQIIDESNLTALPDDSRATIEVVEGRRTHLRITPPENLETMLREEVAKTLGDIEKLSVEQQKPRPVKLEVVGQTEMIEPEKFEFQPAGPRGSRGGYGATGYGSRGGYGAYGGAR